jgi:hypothetical protein
MCCVREKTHLALAMKELARHIEPKRRLNVHTPGTLLKDKSLKRLAT